MAEYCIGIDLGGTFIKFGLMDARHRTRGIFQLPTPAGEGADAVVARMVEGARRLIGEAGLGLDAVAGIGIGSPGPLNLSEGIIYAMPNIRGMAGCRIRDRVADGVGLPAVLENDANAAGYGEFLAGAGQGVRDLILLTLGTGLGSGIVQDGRILHGSHEIGGELGHMIVELDGESCGCGQRGCLERYCSATFLADYAMRRLVDGAGDGELRRRFEANGLIDARDVNEARKQGDGLAEEVWQRAARFLALGCVNLARIFDPEMIVLGGGLAKAGDDLLEPVRRHYEAMHWSLTEPKTCLALASLGNDAGVIGAAGVAWQTFGAACPQGA